MIAFLVVVAVAIGAVSAIERHRYDKKYLEWQAETAKRNLQEAKLGVERDAAIKRAEEFEKHAASLEPQIQALEAAAKDRSGLDQQEAAKIKVVTEDFNRESAITDLATDARIRCERLRAKYLAAGLKSAASIDCNRYTAR